MGKCFPRKLKGERGSWFYPGKRKSVKVDMLLSRKLRGRGK